jgi:hypothetical protein
MGRSHRDRTLGGELVLTTPTCPACGAKFSRDPALDVCRKCGLPNQIAALGAEDRAAAIKQWQRGQLPFVPQPTVEFKQGRAARASRRPKKHGVRKGRGSVTQATPRPKYRRKHA